MLQNKMQETYHEEWYKAHFEIIVQSWRERIGQSSNLKSMSGDSNEPKVFQELTTSEHKREPSDVQQLGDDKPDPLDLSNSITSDVPQLGGGKLHPLNVTIENNTRTTDGISVEIEEETSAAEKEVINNNDVEAALLNKESSSSGVKFDNGYPDKLDGIYHQDPTAIKRQLESGHVPKAEEEEECLIKCLYFTMQCCECNLM